MMRIGAIRIAFVVGIGFLQPFIAQGQETWNLEFTGFGNPGTVFTNSTNISSSTYNQNSLFTAPSGTVPGWLTANGNPGGLLGKDFSGITKASGWTVEWDFKAHPTGTLTSTDLVQFADNTNNVSVRYDAGSVQLFGSSGSSSAPVSLDTRQDHSYRLIRQPNSNTVGLYIDNNFTSPATSFTPASTSSNLNRVRWGSSTFEAAYDYFRYKTGSSLPAAPPPQPAGIYIPTEVQHGANNQAYTVNPAVNNNAVLQGKRIPAPWSTGNTIQIMAARGEYEPATFLVNTDTPLQNVSVEVGQLSGAGGTLPSHTLDIKVVQPYFRRVTDWPAKVPTLLVHDPSLFTIANQPPPWVASLPNPRPSDLAYNKTNLLTRAAIDTDTLQPANITDRQQFWVTAHIPDNAKPGTYSAPVTVRPTNGPAMQLTLQVRVPNLKLLAPKQEYSVYYPAFLNGTFPPSSPYAQLSDTQYVNEMRDMVAHGLTNPVFYDGVRTNTNGQLDFSVLEHYISLREQGGMSFQGKPLYLPDNPLLIVQRNLTPAEYSKNVNYTSQIVAWAQQRGYGDVYFMANDEASAGGLTAERPSFQSIHDGGGRVWVSVLNKDYFAAAGDLLDAPVLQHPGHPLWDQGAQAVTADMFLTHPEDMESYAAPSALMTPEIQSVIAAVHQNGYKILSYMDPTAGQALPESQRRFRGLGLWKIGLDGSMTWAYTHITGNNVKFATFNPNTDTLPDLMSDFVFRGEQAPFDTLQFEGFREGVDDARYLNTLLTAMAKASLRGDRPDLVNNTAQWLASLNADAADLDAMRQEMAWRIEALSPVEAQWNLNASGNWNDGLNWTPGAPSDVDAVANFVGAITAGRTIYTDSPVTVGTLKFDNANTYHLAGLGSLTIQTSSGSGSVAVVQGSHKINLPLFFASDTDVTIANGATLLIANPMTIRAGKTVNKSGNLIIQAPLTLEAGASLILASGPTTLSGAPSLGSGAKIKLTNSTLTIDYGGQSSPALEVKGQLTSGYNGGLWNGPGIGTSAALTGLTLGWKDDTASQSILVKYTYYGDANLDGQVDISDLGALATAWQTSAVWSQGDFDYSGSVDISDLGKLATNWQLGVGNPLGPSFDEALASLGLPSTTVPEPAGIAMLASAACAAAYRCRRVRPRQAVK